jgi:hypothetical protein
VIPFVFSTYISKLVFIKLSIFEASPICLDSDDSVASRANATQSDLELGCSDNESNNSSDQQAQLLEIEARYRVQDRVLLPRPQGFPLQSQVPQHQSFPPQDGQVQRQHQGFQGFPLQRHVLPQCQSLPLQVGQIPQHPLQHHVLPQRQVLQSQVLPVSQQESFPPQHHFWQQSVQQAGQLPFLSEGEEFFRAPKPTRSWGYVVIWNARRLKQT